MSDKVMTMSGAELPAGPTATPTPSISSVASGWTWKHVLAVVLGSFAIAGGGYMTWKGWSKDKKTQKWGGIALAGAGAVTIGVAVLLAHLRFKEFEGALLGRGNGAADVFVDPNRVAARGDLVALVDGRRAKVNALATSLDGSRSYDLRVVENGIVAHAPTWVRDEQLAGVIVS